MSVLGIISILSLIAIFVVILSYKVCATNVAVSLIELIVDYVCNNLLAAVPDMTDCLSHFNKAMEQNSLCFAPIKN